MPDKKLTDNEIIKALECLCGGASKCVECPYSPRYAFSLCRRQVAKDTLGLITRQQVEIKRLKKEEDENFKKWNMLTEKTIEHYSTLYEEAKEILKSEAVKEFVERLKEKFVIADCIVTIDNNDIDNLVKELSEDGENNE